jgi:hypothetical protein
MIDLQGWTYGAELELADVDTSIKLPPGNKWCDKDGSICNSNGTANDPKKEFNRFGGEIQTRPANSPKELLQNVLEIYELLKVGPNCFNFTTNLHVHVRVPGLKESLPQLKLIATYVNEHGKELFNLIEPIPKPKRQEFLSSDAFNGAWERFKRRGRSHHYVPTLKTYVAMMEAKTPQEFYEAHASQDKSGKRMWHWVVRSGVNIKQVFEDTETVEFRHFTMSPDPVKMFSALRWPEIFLRGLFTSPILKTPKQYMTENPELEFQGFYPYNYELDKIFQMTNVYHNKRSEVRENYAKLIAEGRIKKEDLGV